ncbi:hypothetical protein XENTR_v10010021 [Xenopus tropicalis]|nr:hypothetical protein XENTR_v10010016 [Xenopus tropicalis]KAE8619902.1 hypothetical protein XENTR_v10010019 [Xenopus tropicalis]KAE8619904.1 hypothetical protein XENTR_v10010021 [Xenopus tropicalis]
MSSAASAASSLTSILQILFSSSSSSSSSSLMPASSSESSSSSPRCPVFQNAYGCMHIRAENPNTTNPINPRTAVIRRGVVNINKWEYVTAYTLYTEGG